MRRNLTILVWCLMLIAGRLSASPYEDVNWSSDVNGHQWGVWRVVDVPTEGLDNRFTWSGFKTYWYVGFGTFMLVQVSQGTLLAVSVLLVITIVVSASVVLWSRKKKQPEPEHPSDG